MNLVIGVALIGLTIGMIIFARPSDGVSAPYLKVYIVGQAYLLTAMISAVIGIAFIIVNFPV
jgi:hypothetical protein